MKRHLNKTDAGAIQRETGHDIIIVLAVSPTTGEIEYASYGKDAPMCAAGKTIADACFNYVQNMFEDAEHILAKRSAVK